jgi:hypothetical protein
MLCAKKGSGCCDTKPVSAYGFAAPDFAGQISPPDCRLATCRTGKYRLGYFRLTTPTRLGALMSTPPECPNGGGGVIWSAVIPAKAGIHAATMALRLCTGPSGLELLGSNESNLPLDSRFRGNDCLHRPARKINFPQMTPLPERSAARLTSSRVKGIFCPYGIPILDEEH